MATTAIPGLTRLDRCDRCGAAAMLRAALPTGGELLFCGHHAREHGPALHAMAAVLTIELSEAHTAARRGLPGAPGQVAITSWVRHPG